MTTIPIPDAVRDNSEKVTDYAFRRDLSPDGGVRDLAFRNETIRYSARFDYDWKMSFGTNPDGQRCRFDVIRNPEGDVRYLFHTEYFTRVPCCTHDAHYAVYYASVTDPEDGVTTLPGAYCDECVTHLRRSAEDSGMTLNLSEPLRIGQHD